MQGRPAPERQRDIFGYHLGYKKEINKTAEKPPGNEREEETTDIQEKPKPKQKQECGQTDSNTNKITVVVTNAGFRHVDRTELSYFTLWTMASIPGLFLLL